MPALVLATRNPHKVAEVGRMLAGAGIGVDPLPEGIELPPEDGTTFADNAVPKAHAAAAATGRAAIGDDSGIEAAALGGGPGIRSARFAGAEASDEQNLLKFIEQVPAGDRLRYVCVIALVDPVSGAQSTFTGVCEGRMAAERRGSGGFGYDPVFLPDEVGDGRTMAQLTALEKDAISHRGRAVQALVRHLASHGLTPP